MDGFTDHHVQFFTAVYKDWLPLLATDKAKQIIINDLQLRIKKGQAKVCACVIMPNHLHLIWRIGKDFRREEVQRDFLSGVLARSGYHFFGKTTHRQRQCK